MWGYLSEGLRTVCVFISCPLSLSHSFLWLYFLLFSCFLESDCFSCCLVVSSMKSLTQAVPTQPALSQTKISWMLLRSPPHTSTLFSVSYLIALLILPCLHATFQIPDRCGFHPIRLLAKPPVCRKFLYCRDYRTLLVITVERRAHLGLGDGVGLPECFKNLFFF